jgi:hypothetical protein
VPGKKQFIEFPCPVDRLSSQRFSGYEPNTALDHPLLSVGADGARSKSSPAKFLCNLGSLVQLQLMNLFIASVELPNL